MNNGERKLWVLTLFMLTLVRTIQSFQIVDCGSNKIRSINLNTRSKKGRIVYNENTAVNIPNNDLKVNIWCKSDVVFDRCILHHQRKSKPIETKCECSCPPGRKNKVSCNNNPQIRYDSFDMSQMANSTDYKCQFTFQKIKEGGK